MEPVVVVAAAADSAVAVGDTVVVPLDHNNFLRFVDHHDNCCRNYCSAAADTDSKQYFRIGSDHDCRSLAHSSGAEVLRVEVEAIHFEAAGVVEEAW